MTARPRDPWSRSPKIPQEVEPDNVLALSCYPGLKEAPELENVDEFLGKNRQRSETMLYHDIMLFTEVWDSGGVPVKCLILFLSPSNGIPWSSMFLPRILSQWWGIWVRMNWSQICLLVYIKTHFEHLMDLTGIHQKRFYQHHGIIRYF